MKITKEFTKEQLIAKAEEQIKLTRGLNLTLSAKEHVDMCSVLFEIALASLEAEDKLIFVASQESLGDLRGYWLRISKGFTYQETPPASAGNTVD
jgi:hypothetical protein